MPQTVTILLNTADRARLVEIIGNRNRPLKHIQRAKIVLHSGDRLSVLEVARRAGVRTPATISESHSLCVVRWRDSRVMDSRGSRGPLSAVG